MSSSTVQRQARFKIEYLPIKAHYFLYFGGVSSLWAFISVFAKQLGISELGVGYIFLIGPIAGLAAKLVFGALADKYKKKKALFTFCILLNVTTFVAIYFIPEKRPERLVQVDCAVGQSYINQCNRTSPLCGEKLLESFKGKGDSSGEACTGFCLMNDFKEGADFCLNVYRNNTPNKCYGFYRPRDNSEDSFMYSPKPPGDASVSNSELDFTSDEDLYYEAYRLTFNLTIDIKSALYTERCMKLPISRLRFPGNPLDKNSGKLGLSCHRRSMIRNCYIDCPGHPELNSFLDSVVEEGDMLRSARFWMYGLLVVSSWVAMSVVETFSDVLCFDTLGTDAHLYGKQRLWGVVGWGLFGLIAGLVVDKLSKGKVFKDYRPCFYLAISLLSLDLIVAYKWDVKEYERAKSLRKDVCMLLSKVKILIFILACFVVGMCTGLLWHFLFWYVESFAEDSASCGSNSNIKILQGLILAVQCFAGELPFFFFSGWFLKKIGHVHCMSLVLFFFGVRFIIYSYLTNPWQVLPVELFQGFTYGIFYATMVTYANRISPPGTSATVQGVVHAAFVGLGVSAGSLIGGLLFENASGAVAFRCFGFGSLIFCFLHVVSMHILTGGEYEETNERETQGQEMFCLSNEE